MAQHDADSSCLTPVGGLPSDIAFRETMEAINTGTLKQERAAAYLADRIVNPSKAMVEAAHEAALYTTYQTKMGTRGDFLDLASLAQKTKQHKI